MKIELIAADRGRLYPVKAEIVEIKTTPIEKISVSIIFLLAQFTT